MDASFTKKHLLVLSLVYLGIGLFYSGLNFIAHITTHIPSYPVNGGAVFMTPGDQFQAFFRYLLVKYNILRGYDFYYSGYIFNVDANHPPYSEGLIHFPLSFAVSLLSFVTGDILAYNLMVLLSYALCGVASYVLVFEITKNWRGAFIASIFYTCFPFRTAWLYGAMMFGADLFLPPLSVLFLERAVKSNKNRYFVLFGLVNIMLVTANVQLFYFYVFFSIPYFLYRITGYFTNACFSVKTKARNAILLGVGFLAGITYIYYLKQTVLPGSVYAIPFSYETIKNFSPSLAHMRAPFLEVKSGLAPVEGALYIGWTVIAVVPIFFALSRGQYLNKENQVLCYLFLALFIIVYLMSLGANLDRYSGVDLYRWYYQNVPFAKRIRTPGRAMSVAGLYYCLVLGILLSAFFRWIENRLKKFEYEGTLAVNKGNFLTTIAVLTSLVIVMDFNYLNVQLCGLEEKNEAYKSVEGAKEIVLGVPFQEPAHYYDGIFSYYGMKYNLKMFSGNGTAWPLRYRQTVLFLKSINEGEIAEEQWRYMTRNGIGYLTARHTFQQPAVSDEALRKLLGSPYLEFVKSDNDVYLFKIKAIL